MKRLFIAIMFLSIPLIGFSQNELLNDLLSTSLIGRQEAPSRILDHINHLKSKQYKKEVNFLHKIFWSTQQEFLKTYSPYEPFGELFVSGKYDCLTATSLYSLILNEFHFDYSIIETNYHIFIMIHTSSGDVLMETTDRYNGFVYERNEIEERIGSYKKNLIATNGSDKSFFRYSFDLYKKINPNQLSGLLHFNQAVNAFNAKQWLACADELVLSESKYESPRVKELALLLVQAVLNSDTNEEIQELITQRFKPYWLEKQPVIATN